MTAHDHIRTTIDLPIKEHRKLKAIAAMRGISMKALILEYLSQELYSDNVPNEETEKVMREADKGKNVTHHKDFNALRSHLGI